MVKLIIVFVTMKESLKNIPIFGPAGRNIARVLKKISRVLRGENTHNEYAFERQPVAASSHDNNDLETKQILNLLNYTKTSNQSYNAQIYPAGYHSLSITGFNITGQRNPAQRIELVPFNFSGKTVLDIGCNQGGMLFSVATKALHGIGIDFDSRLINAANKIRSHIKQQNLDFYVFDLEKEDLQIIRDFLPGEKVNITFLLSICMWIKNWREVIDLTSKISECLLFESNGTKEQQQEQLKYLKATYEEVKLIQEQSDDDEGQKNRKLYFCK